MYAVFIVFIVTILSSVHTRHHSIEYIVVPSGRQELSLTWV
jgi:hypothetical protein